jgi:hypothetical protein
MGFEISNGIAELLAGLSAAEAEVTQFLRFHCPSLTFRK